MDTPVNASRTEAQVDQALIAALNELLEAERAGARVARAYSVSASVASVGEALLRVGRDEAWCCGMLTRHIERLGGRVSRKTGAFYDKALRKVGLGERLDYLERGQDWVVRRLQELIPASRTRRSVTTWGGCSQCTNATSHVARSSTARPVAECRSGGTRMPRSTRKEDS